MENTKKFAQWIIIMLVIETVVCYCYSIPSLAHATDPKGYLIPFETMIITSLVLIGFWMCFYISMKEPLAGPSKFLNMNPKVFGIIAQSVRLVYTISSIITIFWFTRIASQTTNITFHNIESNDLLDQVQLYNKIGQIQNLIEIASIVLVVLTLVLLALKFRKGSMLQLSAYIYAGIMLAELIINKNAGTNSFINRFGSGLETASAIWFLVSFIIDKDPTGQTADTVPATEN